MAAGMLHLEGATELLAALGQLEPALSNRVLRTAMRSAAKPILAKAKANAPVVTGALKASLKVRAMKRKKGRVGVVVQTRDGDYRGKQFYGSFIEYGTSKIAAKPYMRPAFDTQAPASLKILETEIRHGIEKVADGLWKGRKK